MKRWRERKREIPCEKEGRNKRRKKKKKSEGREEGWTGGGEAMA